MKGLSIFVAGWFPSNWNDAGHELALPSFQLLTSCFFASIEISFSDAIYAHFQSLPLPSKRLHRHWAYQTFEA